MAITAADIKFYLTGASSDGGAQADPNLSFGNYRSSSEIVDAVSNNLLDDASGFEVDYRCICIKNTHATDSLTNPVVWLSKYVSNLYSIAFAVEVPNGGDTTGYVQTIASESTAPVVGSGNVSTWSSATTKGAGVPLDQGSHDVNLDAGEIIFVWISRIMDPLPFPSSGESIKIRIETL